MATIVKYDNWQKGALDGSAAIDWDTDTIKVMLVSSSYTPSVAHTTQANITNEVSGTNYTADGETIASVAVTEASGVAKVDGADVTWSQNAGGFTTARYAIIYKYVDATDTNNDLVGYIDFTSDKGNVNGDLTLQWNAGGIFTQT